MGRYFQLGLVAWLVATAAWGEDGERVQWKRLFMQSSIFLGIENGFRYATEPATRHPQMPFFKGYVDSVTNLHGWKDGNPFLDNYIGHPMQGAVSGYIWAQNDPKFWNVEFGRNPSYWKSRLRAALFSWAYSTQIEIGPFSEASIGNIQAKRPEQGLVDHVVTPVVGTAWMIGEDVLDRYVIRRLERRTTNRVYRVLARGGLNPTRSFANVIGGKWPWARTADEAERLLPAEERRLARARMDVEPPRGVAPFELSLNSYVLDAGNRPCLGGGTTVAVRMGEEWQWVGDWNGCMSRGLTTDRTGDFMTYMMGPRWTPLRTGRWHPYLQALAGGSKATQEVLAAGKAPLDLDTAGPAIAAGGGLDFRLNAAISFRVVSVEYTRAWIHDLPGFSARRGWQFKGAFVVRAGTW